LRAANAGRLWLGGIGQGGREGRRGAGAARTRIFPRDSSPRLRSASALAASLSSPLSRCAAWTATSLIAAFAVYWRDVQAALYVSRRCIWFVWLWRPDGLPFRVRSHRNVAMLVRYVFNALSAGSLPSTCDSTRARGGVPLAGDAFVSPHTVPQQPRLCGVPVTLSR